MSVEFNRVDWKHPGQVIIESPIGIVTIVYTIFDFKKFVLSKLWDYLTKDCFNLGHNSIEITGYQL